MAAVGNTGDVRLTGGSEDEEGGWAYGRLEILVDGIWNAVPETGVDVLGRRGVEVRHLFMQHACM